MPYRDRLNSWAVVRLLPKLQRVVVSRHRSESDADGHCQVLRRLEPDAEFIVMFDPIVEERSIQFICTGISKIFSALAIVRN
ncbi:hypothetical protein H6F43_13880 [Leptolyngbya sp. FACHB-36]|uniref:hypothetical protein n=1 Tax=Leptolyngbya sp. FACHB-36 TaxID=2692808 RepID=UPI0016806CEE|nr:hypothetical protein [Leptolyngbya sp. FACHB-36]MBD2021265.1 hypothetical protein [Leptolyngbya sp. FACHB-36]